MALNINHLKKLFTKLEPVRVVECGPADLFGEAKCVLEDGSIQNVIYPVKGKPAFYWKHEAEVIRSEHSAETFIKPYGEKPINIQELIKTGNKE